MWIKYSEITFAYVVKVISQFFQLWECEVLMQNTKKQESLRGHCIVKRNSQVAHILSLHKKIIPLTILLKQVELTYSKAFTNGRFLSIVEWVGQHNAIMKLQNYLTRRMSVCHNILQFSANTVMVYVSQKLIIFRFADGGCLMSKNAPGTTNIGYANENQLPGAFIIIEINQNDNHKKC